MAVGVHAPSLRHTDYQLQTDRLTNSASQIDNESLPPGTLGC
jgi:hypothetical protein